MKHYSTYQSQFIEMFGDVENNTKHYPVMQIKEIADTYAGATPSTSNPDFWENGTIPWMSSGEVHKGRVDQTDAMITQSGYDKCSTKMVPKHSVVIALAGQGKTRGTVAVNNIELCTNQSLCAIVPNEEIHYEYLYHNLRGRYTELRSMSGDVNGRGGLNLKHIQSIRVVVPPKEDQHKFVAIAEQADKSKFTSLKSQFIEMFGSSNKIKLGELATFVNGSAFKPEEWGESGLPIVRIQNLTGSGEGYNRYNGDITKKVIIEPGDILISWSATLGVYIWAGERALLNQHIFRADIDKDKVDKDFFIYTVQAALNIMGENAHGSTMKHVVKKDFDDTLVAYPSFAEQRRFSTIYKQADKSKYIN